MRFNVYQIFEMGGIQSQNLVYEKKDLLIDGEEASYNRLQLVLRVAGEGGKEKGEAQNKNHR
jgi:hypothetical protein